MAMGLYFKPKRVIKLSPFAIAISYILLKSWQKHHNHEMQEFYFSSRDLKYTQEANYNPNAV